MGLYFCQTRVGFMDQPFQMIKFRSMIPDAEKFAGPVMVNESGDSRYIKGGQFLRQYSIDELPQLWNVLKGEMSIVGPRPERPPSLINLKKDCRCLASVMLFLLGLLGGLKLMVDQC